MIVNYYEIECQNAQEFLRTVRLSNDDLWHSSIHPEWTRNYVFRGESSVQWDELIPKAWRTGKYKPEELVVNEEWRKLTVKLRERNFSQFLDLDGDTLLERVQQVILHTKSELVLVYQFESLSNELGFRVTNLPTMAYSWSDEYIDDLIQFVFPLNESNENISKEYTLSKHHRGGMIWNNPIIALAAHHGIATRLLDWTNDPLVAAFFAARDAYKSDQDDKIAVYAVNVSLFFSSHIKVITVPTADNPYLQAQSGIFTIDTQADDYYVKNGTFPSLLGSINSLDPLPPIGSAIAPVRITLPTSQALDLLRLLWLEGVSQAHLMPTLDNVANATKMKTKMSKAINQNIESKSPIKSVHMGFMK